MRFLDRWRSTLTITVRREHARCIKGKVPAACLHDIHALFAAENLDTGEIYLTGDGRLDFSPDTPKHLHQPLRNIVLGQHNPS